MQTAGLLVLVLVQPLPAGDALGRVLTLLRAGDTAAAERLVAADPQSLAAEMAAALADVDRDFDDMSRQKVRSDALAPTFERLQLRLADHDKVFRLYARVTGDQKSLRTLEAKKLRIDGAQHTSRADLLWDRLEYAAALEEYSVAVGKLREAIPLARLVEDQKLIGSCLNNIGYAEIYRGNETEGLRHYLDALKIADQRDDDVYRGLYNLNLGTYYVYTGQSQESLRYSLEAAALTRKTGRKTWEANALLNAGSAQLALGRTVEARATLEDALARSTEANDLRSRGRIRFNLALVAGAAREDARAVQEMEAALRWFREHEDVYSVAEQTVAQYHGLSFLAATSKRMQDDASAQSYGSRLRELRARDPETLAAYLADPHMNYSKWSEFRERR
jgi:tetratricopeptide (TPR) repeat protein